MFAFHSSSSSLDFTTILTNVYTWIAVITAALISLWRIRSATSNSLISCKLTPLPPPETAAASAAGNEIQDRRPDSTRPSVVIVPTRLSESGKSAIISSTRRKFKEYYDIDCNEDDDCSSIIGEVTESSFRRIDGYRRIPMEWEKLLRTKMEELSWYRFQDLTVFDGNIVKFWTAGDLHR